MQVLGTASVERFLRQHAAARGPMARWVQIVRAAEWRDVTDARRTLPTADAIRGTNLTCFNVGGNNFRLVTAVSYQRQEVIVRELMTHAEYDKKYVR